MSTRSRIGIEGEDGTIQSIYCHSDGYPSGVGAVLLAHHNSAPAAMALVALGDLSFCEGAEVCPAGERIPGMVCSYRLWRNESGTEAITAHSRAEYQQQAYKSDGEFVYLYGPRGWEYAPVLPITRFKPLTEEAISKARGAGL